MNVHKATALTPLTAQASMLRSLDGNTPSSLTATPEQFAFLRDTIDVLEQQANSSMAARLPEPEVVTKPTVPRGSRRRSPKGQQPMSDATQQANTAPKSNTVTMAELLLTADEFGKQAALGGDVQIKFDLKVAEAAFCGALDLQKNKHGQGLDDATKLAEAYAKGRNTNVIFDHRDMKQRKLASDLRTDIKLGSSPKFGVGEPMGTINTLMTTHRHLRQTANKSGKKIVDAHNMFMRFARTQLTRDTLISGDELKSFCFKKDPDQRQLAAVYSQILGTMVKARDGKLSNCPDADSSTEVNTIINACNRRLSAIAKAKGEEQAA